MSNYLWGCKETGHLFLRKNSGSADTSILTAKNISKIKKIK
jgi:hypothetical protein